MTGALQIDWQWPMSPTHTYVPTYHWKGREQELKRFIGIKNTTTQHDMTSNIPNVVCGEQQAKTSPILVQYYAKYKLFTNNHNYMYVCTTVWESSPIFYSGSHWMLNTLAWDQWKTSQLEKCPRNIASRSYGHIIYGIVLNMRIYVWVQEVYIQRF